VLSLVGHCPLRHGPGGAQYGRELRTEVYSVAKVLLFGSLFGI